MSLSADVRQINVVVLEDDLHMRESLCGAIKGEFGLNLQASFSQLAPLLEWLVFNQPQVLLVDLDLPDGSGIDAIKHCASRYPECDVMVITIFGDEKNVLAAIDAGAKGYLLKEAEQLDIGKFISALREGGSPMSPLVARKLLSRSRSVPLMFGQSVAEAGAESSPLTTREMEVLNLITRGYTYGEIAGLLEIGYGTVQSHVKRIYVKLAVHNRSEAVFEARSLGLLSENIKQSTE